VFKCSDDTSATGRYSEKTAAGNRGCKARGL
jgi:hypothetical protein